LRLATKFLQIGGGQRGHSIVGAHYRREETRLNKVVSRIQAVRRSGGCAYRKFDPGGIFA
jgi:hypothetical protein